MKKDSRKVFVPVGKKKISLDSQNLDYKNWLFDFKFQMLNLDIWLLKFF